MTKTIVIGSENESKKDKKIEFIALLTDEKNPRIMSGYCGYAKKWNYIELITENYSKDIDIMFAYMDKNKRNEGTLYLGKWNDGIV